MALTLILVVLGLGVFALLKVINKPKPQPVVEQPKPFARQVVIGKSVQGRNIEAYTYGNGPKHLVFVGGIHGGYEWNSVLLAYNFMDSITADPKTIPEQLTVTVIPNANPDAVFAVTGKEGRFAATDITANAEAQAEARFNANKVDLNRNFACKWAPTGTWRSRTVSAGTEAFSEPESRAIRDFALAQKPSAMVFWHSQANTVYASECENGPLPDTVAIMKAYADAAGYQSQISFDSYEVHGDAEGWLASVGIPAITVELKTHETIEWPQNLLGIKALFNYYSR